MNDGWEIEDTGGGCQWLRKGRFAITDGDAGLPCEGEACALVMLNEAGDYELMEGEFATPEAAKAHVAKITSMEVE